MNDSARSADRLRHFCAAKSVERFNLKVFAQREESLFRQESVTVVTDRTANLRKLLFLLIADQNLRRSNARQFIEQRLSILQLRQSKLASR